MVKVCAARHTWNLKLIEILSLARWHTLKRLILRRLNLGKLHLPLKLIGLDVLVVNGRILVALNLRVGADWTGWLAIADRLARVCRYLI